MTLVKKLSTANGSIATSIPKDSFSNIEFEPTGKYSIYITFSTKDDSFSGEVGDIIDAIRFAKSLLDKTISIYLYSRHADNCEKALEFLYILFLLLHF